MHPPKVSRSVSIHPTAAMKRALVIRNVAHHDVPLDSLDNACVQAFTANGFLTEIAVLHDSEIMRQLMPTSNRGASPCFDAVLFRAAGLPSTRILPMVKMVRTISKQLFLCVFSSQLVEHPRGRYECFQEGASMVTSSLEDVHRVMRFIGSCPDNQSNYLGGYTCPICAKSGFSEDELWRHAPLYHINEANREDLTCPICRQGTRGPFQVHLHNAHGPPGRGEMASEFRMGESTLYSFALVVCHNRKYNSFLLVQEFASSGFWLPGGRIDSGENPAQAAIRETKEEAGIDIRLTGVIKIEYHPKKDRSGNNYVRMRFIFYAEPLDCDQLPKSIPDYESAGATWCKADQVAALPLRGPEPTIYFSYVADGKPIYPIEMIQVSSTSPNSSSSSNRRH
jgi:8-oxo-dGTP pyrophosphatase MutT (NUDIX family)